MDEVHKIFQDIAHVHFDGHLVFVINTDENNTKRLQIALFLRDYLLSAVITNIRNSQNGGAERNRSDLMQRCAELILDLGYTPKSAMFLVPDIKPYKQGTYDLLESSDEVVGGCCLRHSIIIQPDPIKENAVKNSILGREDIPLLDKVKSIASQYPSIFLSEAINGGLVFDIFWQHAP